MAKLNINGTVREVSAEADTPLLWVIREHVGLTGTKYGCGIAQCGACSVHFNGEVQRSCQIPFGQITESDKIVTIEGLAKPDGTLHPVQQGVIDEQGFQCAYCMPGFVMATVGFLKTNPNPTRAGLARGVSGNLCRCQDYDKILTAMMRGAENLRKASHA